MQMLARSGGASTRTMAVGSHRFFYQVLLPAGIVVNFGLGIAVLAGLQPQSWLSWSQLAVGAFCCAVAGWLFAAAWSKVYWNRSMARQVAKWRLITDTFFMWVDDMSLPAESVQELKRSLEPIIPTQEQRPTPLA